MHRNTSGTLRVCLILTVIAIGLRLGQPPSAQSPDPEILVIDFTGNLSNGADHALTFKQTVLSHASVMSIGIRGRVVPDAGRQEAGYDAIIPAFSPRDYESSAHVVYALITARQTILGFDINEVFPPQQIRKQGKGLTPDQIIHPAMVAARVAQKWRQAHPRGYLILRGHSDGTYALAYIFDDLKRRREEMPHVVILESPRQRYREWAARARATPETRFVAITADHDFWREVTNDPDYANVPSANWVNLHVKGRRLWWDAHSVVTDYHNPRLRVKRTGADGQRFFETVSLGYLVTTELDRVIPIEPPKPPPSWLEHDDIPDADEWPKFHFTDPWDRGRGSAAGVDKSRRPPESRGGISAGIQIRPGDFTTR